MQVEVVLQGLGVDQAYDGAASESAELLADEV